MTNYEKLISSKVDLVDLLEVVSNWDVCPWDKWFEKKYCKNCESVPVVMPNGRVTTDCWCAEHDQCRFFQDKKEIPDLRDIIEMWLAEEYDLEIPVNDPDELDNPDDKPIHPEPDDKRIHPEVEE